MRRFYLIFSVLLMTLSCTKTIDVYILNKPQDPIVNLPPGEFEISVTKLTDQSLDISWTIPIDPESDVLRYSVAVNDSILAFDMVSNSYSINNLTPDQDYNVKVIATDAQFNKKAITKVVHTMKSAFYQAISFSTGKKNYNIMGIFQCSDNGYLLSGYLTEYGESNKNFLIKLASDYSIIYQNEFSNNSTMMDYLPVIESSDHNIISVCGNAIYKLTPQGNIIWSYRGDNSRCYFTNIAEASDGSLYVAGNYGYAASPLNSEYVVIKLAANGTELLRKVSNRGSTNRIYQLMIDNNNLILVGTEKDNMPYVTRLDMNANLISNTNFPNKYNNGYESPFSLVVTKDNDYLLITSLSVLIGSSAAYNDLQRILKIGKDGTIRWEHYYTLSSGSFSTRFSGICVLDNGKYLTAIRDGSGFGIVQLDSQGNIERQNIFYGVLGGNTIKLTDQGKYLTFNRSQLLLLNPDGYYP